MASVKVKSAHARPIRRTDAPEIVVAKMRARLMFHVRIEGEHWIWKRGLHVRWVDKSIEARRAFWRAFRVEPEIAGHCIVQACPVRGCVRPDHIAQAEDANDSTLRPSPAERYFLSSPRMPPEAVTELRRARERLPHGSRTAFYEDVARRYDMSVGSVALIATGHRGKRAEEAAQLRDIAWLMQRLGVPRGTVHCWVHRKQVPFIRIGPRSVRFDPAVIDRWLAEREGMVA